MPRLQVPIVVLSLIATACGDGSPTSPDATASFQGLWQGTWNRTSCTEGPGAAGVCSATPASGALSLSITQSDSSVQGTVSVSPFVVPISGSVTGNVLDVSGQTWVVGAEGGGTVKILNWSTTRNGNAMSGSFTLTIEPDDPRNGSLTLRVALQNVTLSA